LTARRAKRRAPVKIIVTIAGQNHAWQGASLRARRRQKQATVVNLIMAIY
jgi:ribosomal protein L35